MSYDDIRYCCLGSSGCLRDYLCFGWFALGVLLTRSPNATDPNYLGKGRFPDGAQRMTKEGWALGESFGTLPISSSALEVLDTGSPSCALQDLVEVVHPYRFRDVIIHPGLNTLRTVCDHCTSRCCDNDYVASVRFF